MGPFKVVDTRRSADGQPLHKFRPSADPYLGALLALLRDDSRSPLSDVKSAEDEDLVTQQKGGEGAGKRVGATRLCL